MGQGDVQFGNYLFPRGFILAGDEPQYESDIVSVPQTVGSDDPTPKLKTRKLTVSGSIAQGAKSNQLVSAINTFTDVQAEMDRMLAELSFGTYTALMYRGGRPLFPPTWDRFYIAKPGAPRIAFAEGTSLRYRDVVIDFMASDPRAFLCSPGNMVPDRDFKLLGQTWTVTGALTALLGGGSQANNAYQYTGTGAASGTITLASPIYAVIPGQQYTVSGYVNATSVTAGAPQVLLMDPTLTTTYGSVNAAISAGRNSFLVTIPANVYFVRFVFNTNNCTVTNAAALKFDSPAMGPGTVDVSLFPDPFTPRNQLVSATFTDLSAHVVTVTTVGTYRSYPTIVILAGPSGNAGFNGITISITTAMGFVVSIVIPTTWNLLNGAILIINCDPLRPSCIAAPAVCLPRKAIGGSGPPFASMTNSNNAGNLEPLPYLDPGANSVSFQAGTAPSGGVSYTAAVIWDDVVI